MTFPRKGTPEYEEWITTPEYAAMREKMAAARRGKPSHMRGRKLTDEQRAKISQSKIGKKRPDMVERRKGKYKFPEGAHEKARAVQRSHPSPLIGRPKSAETKAKISATLTGKPGPWLGKKRPEAGVWLREGRNEKGEPPWNKGVPMTPELKAKISEVRKQQWEQYTDEERQLRVSNWIEASRDKRNTSIEQFMASKLDAQGVVYVREKHIGRYRVDFYIPSTHTVIEVQGCYWHGCLPCGHDSEEHREKRKQDAKRFERLRSKGYTVLEAWEHDLRKEMQ